MSDRTKIQQQSEAQKLATILDKIKTWADDQHFKRAIPATQCICMECVTRRQVLKIIAENSSESPMKG